MKIIKFDTEEAWSAGRLGKITGTRLKDLVVKRGNNKKIGYYEIIAELLAIPPDGENAMDRGLRLEAEAIERFEKETGKKVNTDLVIWERDDNNAIAISPDGFMGKTEAIEIKCLGSAYHIKALLENQVPSDYMEQAMQYFIVNDDLERLYFAFYDPRIKYKDFFYFTLTRDEYENQIDSYLDLERDTMEEIKETVNELSGF